jgi:hypothetical protein
MTSVFSPVRNFEVLGCDRTVPDRYTQPVQKSVRVLRVRSYGTLLLMSVWFWSAFRAFAISAESVAASPAWVRLWNFNHPTGSTLFVSEDSDRSTPLVETPANSVCAGYIPFSPGNHRLRIQSDPTDTELPFILRIASGHFVTLLASFPNGTLHLQLLNDTPSPNPALSASLTVRHFIPNTSISVFCPPLPQIRGLSFRTDRTLTGLPRGLTPLRLKANRPGQAETEWSLQADFTHCPTQTLLLVLDPYGRFRPRLVPSGQSELHPAPEEDPTSPNSPLEP